MKNIIEIQISNHKVSKKKQWEILVGLYDEILHKDKNWHFFYEIFFNIVRCSDKYKNDVCRYLGEHFVRYESRGLWVDNQPITKKHQKHFSIIFHEYSELIMKTGNIIVAEDLKNEVWYLADRMIHCFLNNCYYIAEPWKEEARLSASWENTIMSQLAAGRTNYNRNIAKQIDKIDLRDYGASEVECKSSKKKKIEV